MSSLIKLRHRSRLRYCMVAIVVCALPAGCNDRQETTSRNAGDRLDDPEPGTPAGTESQYVTSASCRECHPQQFESWDASYHQSMTQEPTLETVQGRFDGTELSVNGYRCAAIERDGEFSMLLIDPNWEHQQRSYGRDPRSDENPPMVTYSVDRLIGSHHQQVYLSKDPDGAYHTLPLVWNISEQRWITRSASFLSHSRGGFYHKTKLWNNGCIFCHNTGPQPGLVQQQTLAGTEYSWDSQVVELGIACEACHGPGRDHVRKERELAAANIQEAHRPADSNIVNPSLLPNTQMVLVCSRCHGKMIARQEFDRECLVSGDFFESGDWDYPRYYDHPWLEQDEDYHESREGEYFWSDGTPRTTALEYQGLLLTSCYQNGEMSCLSCHSMHESHPNDQLVFGDNPRLKIADQNQACTQCHDSFEQRAELAAHTHHPPASSGSLCYNCHMPFQAYSLLKRIRSHRITTPSAQVTDRHGVPNACNQCHVDRSLAWTNETLAEWNEQTPLALNQPPDIVSETVRHALSGHALQRALAIEQLGAEENFELAGTDWRSRILLEDLDDEYAAVRFLAYRALRKLPGFTDFEFDYIGTEAARQQQVEQALIRQSSLTTSESLSKLREILGGASDSDVEELIEDLLSRQNQVPIGILE